MLFGHLGPTLKGFEFGGDVGGVHYAFACGEGYGWDGVRGIVEGAGGGVVGFQTTGRMSENMVI